MSIPDRLRHNLGLKLVSLVVALAIWGTVHNQADPLLTRQQQVPIEAVGVPTGLAVASTEPREVTVVLAGRRSALERLAYSDARLIADLSQASIGSVSAPLKPRGFPAGVEIRYLATRMVKVTLDSVVSRTRPVFVQTRGEPAQGFMVTGSQVRPTEVTVSGPSVEVRKVGRVLAPVDVSGRTDSAPVAVELMPLDVAGLPVNGVKVEPAQATVTVQMRQVNSRTVPVAPVIAKVPEGYEVASVVARPVVVSVTGEVAALAALAAVQTAPVDLTSEPGKTQYVVALRPPSGVTVLGTTSVRVTVTLRKAGSGSETPPSTATPAPPAATPPEDTTGATTDKPETPRTPAPHTPTPPAGGTGAANPKPPAAGSHTTSPPPAQP